MLLLAQERPAEAVGIPEPLHADLCVVFGPDDEMAPKWPRFWP